MSNSGLVVIGAGLPRTGTTSTRAALEELLGGPCYHMKTVVFERSGEEEHWLKAVKDQANPDRKILSDQDWINFFSGRGFKAGVDYPVSLFYKELMKIYPDAKIVLTVRDNPEAWYKSVNATVYKISLLAKQFETRLVQKILGKYEVFQAVTKICRHPVRDFQTGMYGAVEQGLAESTKFYEEWIEDVKRSVPKERLLIFNAKQGWKPLCQFLEIPLPNHGQPFPHVNETKEFVRILRFFKLSSFFLAYIFPVGIASITYYFRHSITALFKA